MSVFDRANDLAKDRSTRFLQRLFPRHKFREADAYHDCPSCGREKRFGVFGCFKARCALHGPMSPVFLASRVLGVSPTEAADWILGEGEQDPVLQARARSLEMAQWQPRELDITPRAAIPEGCSPVCADGLRFMLERGVKTHTLRRHGALWCPDGYHGRRVILPITDLQHRPMMWVGRAVDDGVEPKYLYPKGPKKGQTVYPVEDGPWVVVVEGPIDALMWRQAGYPASAILGSRASQEQIAWLLRKRMVTVALDGDEAGREGRDRLVEMLVGLVDELRVVDLPDGRDPGDTDPDDVLPGRVVSSGSYDMSRVRSRLERMVR